MQSKYKNTQPADPYITTTSLSRLTVLTYIVLSLTAQYINIY